ncbi:Helicase C-terminal [Trinorchestia longiramus]|nr:Helicase C-terminal [Trinorchestia longiramus]
MPGVAVAMKTRPKNKASKSNNSSNAVTVEEKDEDKNSVLPLPLKSVGHVLKKGEMRSQDVNILEDVHFADMYFKEEVLAGLHSTGFMKPSPVQLQAIPTGCCGLDLIVQAKSGTGKTCVFTVVALEMVATSAPTCQVLVVAPTREIAVQIASVMRSVGRHMAALRVQTFIGGTDVEKNTSCHIAVGTPGRLHHLLSAGILSPKNIRLLVLDEADQLLESFRNVVLQIVAALPLSKQIICTSATYTPSLQDLAKKMMRSPSHISLGSKQLLAVTQYVHKLPYTESLDKAFRGKLLHLKGILGSVVFNQCLIFTNSITRCESVYDSLHRDGWPVARLCGGQTQQQRLKALDDLTTHKCRVMVATDLAARGLDSPHVSLVVSLEPPPHPHTYLHRVGRAGRFGSRGLSVVLACQGDDWLHVQAIATVLDLTLLILPEPSLAQHAEPLQRLPLLTSEQLQQWTLSTSHRLTYSSAFNGGSYDPLEITPSQERSTKDSLGSLSSTNGAKIKNKEQDDVAAATLPVAEKTVKEKVYSISMVESPTSKNKCTKNENKNEICSCSDFVTTDNNDGNINTRLDLSSNLNEMGKNEETIHSCAELESPNDESTELKELAEIVRLEQPEFVSSFSFDSIREELAALEANTDEEKRQHGSVVVGHAAGDPHEATAARLSVLLARQHQRHAERLSEMKEKWEGVTVVPRQALAALQRGCTTDELLTQLQQDVSATDLAATEETKGNEEVASARSFKPVQVPGSASVPHQADTFQFHIKVMKKEKHEEKLDRKKRANVVKSGDKLSEDMNAALCPPQTESRKSEKQQNHDHGARKKERLGADSVMHGKDINSASYDGYDRSVANRRHDERLREHFSPLVLFDRATNVAEHSIKDRNRRCGEDAKCFQLHASHRAEKEGKVRYPGRHRAKYRCEYEGCSRDAVGSDEQSFSSRTEFSDEWNYPGFRYGHERRPKTQKECVMCTQEQHIGCVEAGLKAHLDYYRKFALMNYYVMVMGRTAAAAAQHYRRQYSPQDSHIRSPDSSRRPRAAQPAQGTRCTNLQPAQPAQGRSLNAGKHKLPPRGSK